MSTIPVLVTNTSRGIYFGWAASLQPDAMGRIELTNARHCYRYVTGNGTYGLATIGPQADSVIGPVVSRMSVGNVGNVAECTPAAVAAWEVAGWEK